MPLRELKNREETSDGAGVRRARPARQKAGGRCLVPRRRPAVGRALLLRRQPCHPPEALTFCRPPHGGSADAPPFPRPPGLTPWWPRGLCRKRVPGRSSPPAPRFLPQPPFPCVSPGRARLLSCPGLLSFSRRPAPGGHRAPHTTGPRPGGERASEETIVCAPRGGAGVTRVK